MEDGGRSEEKRRCAVNSKRKLTKNSFLVVSFLIFAKIYSYQPMIWRTWLVGKVGGEYCFGEGEYFFSLNNQRYAQRPKRRDT